jgi:hypothetical protein
MAAAEDRVLKYMADNPGASVTEISDAIVGFGADLDTLADLTGVSRADARAAFAPTPAASESDDGFDIMEALGLVGNINSSLSGASSFPVNQSPVIMNAAPAGVGPNSEYALNAADNTATSTNDEGWQAVDKMPDVNKAINIVDKLLKGSDAATAGGSTIFGFDPGSIIFSLALQAMGIGSKGSQATPMTPAERELNSAGQTVDQALALLDSASFNDFDYEGQGETVEATLSEAIDIVNALPDSGLEFFGDSKDALLAELANSGIDSSTSSQGVKGTWSDIMTGEILPNFNPNTGSGSGTNGYYPLFTPDKNVTTDAASSSSSDSSAASSDSSATAAADVAAAADATAADAADAANIVVGSDSDAATANNTSPLEAVGSGVGDWIYDADAGVFRQSAGIEIFTPVPGTYTDGQTVSYDGAAAVFDKWGDNTTPTGAYPTDAQKDAAFEDVLSGTGTLAEVLSKAIEIYGSTAAAVVAVVTAANTANVSVEDLATAAGVSIEAINQAATDANVTITNQTTAAPSTTTTSTGTCTGGKVKDAAGKCVCPTNKPNFVNGQCEAAGTGTTGTGTCTGGKIKVDGKCVCPTDKPNFVNGQCEAAGTGTTGTGICTGGKIKVDGKCVCPTDKPNFVNGQCEAAGTGTAGTGTCTGGKIKVAGKCVCPTNKPNFVNGQCEAAGTGTTGTGTCTGGKIKVAGKCVCPTNKPNFVNGKCEAAGTGTTGTGTCPAGSGQIKNTAGKCVCPTDKPNLVNGQCEGDGDGDKDGDKGSTFPTSFGAPPNVIPGELGELVDIDYVYDPFGDSIFAPTMEEEKAQDPIANAFTTFTAAEGGIVPNNIDELIKYLRG